MQLYFVHSLTQTCPKLWRSMDVDGLMLSADDLWSSGLRRVRESLGFGGRIVLDSGGFRLLSQRRTFNPEDVLRWQMRTEVDVVVVLDYPLEDGIDRVEAKRRIRKSIENVAMWLDEFQSGRVMPVVHGRTKSDLNYAYDLLIGTYGRVFRYIGFGSVAEIARCSLPRMMQIATYARRLFRGFHLHAFGCGGSSASILSALGFDSVDSASHLCNSRYGLVYDPETGRMCVITETRGCADKPRITPEELFSRCDCPACREGDVRISKWGRKGFLLRALHNAWHLKRLVKRRLVNSRWRRYMEEALSRSGG